MSALFRLSEEAYAAHQRRVADARVVRLCMDEEAAKHVPGRAQKAAERTAGVRATETAPKPQKRRKSQSGAITRQSEAQVMRECQDVLERHPKVAWWFRQNTGAFKLDDRYVKFSFVGASDLMACSTRGRWIAVECKATGKKATEAQASFLASVNAAGGLGVCVDHSGKLALALETL